MNLLSSMHMPAPAVGPLPSPLLPLHSVPRRHARMDVRLTLNP